MAKLFSNSDKKFLKQIDKPESELNKFLCQNWSFLFPKLIFISSEFTLDGNVRSKGTSGRIDILAFNPKSKKFVVFELKKIFDKNITDQAADYRDFIEDNCEKIYIQAIQTYEIPLPKYNEIQHNSVEIFYQKHLVQHK